MSPVVRRAARRMLGRGFFPAASLDRAVARAPLTFRTLDHHGEVVQTRDAYDQRVSARDD